MTQGIKAPFIESQQYHITVLRTSYVDNKKPHVLCLSNILSIENVNKHIAMRDRS